jgi:hypothetical protein
LTIVDGKSATETTYIEQERFHHLLAIQGQVNLWRNSIDMVTENYLIVAAKAYLRVKLKAINVGFIISYSGY